MFDILALGEILLRLSPPMNEKLVRGETFEKQVGGAELNVLSGASLLGLRAGIISKIAENDIGEFARNRVRFVGVSDRKLTKIGNNGRIYTFTMCYNCATIMT